MSEAALGIERVARRVRVAASFEETLERTREALAAQGFGVLTEIDVAATLAQKTGAQLEPYRILGACRPQLAEQAVAADPRIGVLLPCNVVVRAEGQGTLVEALDPELMATVVGGGLLDEVAADATARLDAALAALGTSP